MAQTILLFDISEEKKKSIQAVCQPLGIQVRQVPPKDCSQSLGVLAGIQGFTKKKMSGQGTALPGEMLVFSGVDSDQVDRFLEAYRSCGIAPVRLKAVLTPYNINWTPGQLYAELQREHEMRERIL